MTKKNSKQFEPTYHYPSFESRNTKIDKYLKDSHNAKTLQIPIQNLLLCNSSRPCFGMTHFHNSNKDSKHIVPVTKFKRIQPVNVKYVSRQYDMNPIKNSLQRKTPRPAFNDKSSSDKNKIIVSGSPLFRCFYKTAAFN